VKNRLRGELPREGPEPLADLKADSGRHSQDPENRKNAGQLHMQIPGVYGDLVKGCR
jgi:hypothetical protein